MPPLTVNVDAELMASSPLTLLTVPPLMSMVPFDSMPSLPEQ